jgi:hypothetical protein
LLLRNEKKKIEISLSHYSAHGRAFPNMTFIHWFRSMYLSCAKKIIHE